MRWQYPFSLILAGTSTGLITYADYSERSTKNLAPVIAATPDLADVQLPMGCKYLVLDKNYQVTETTLKGDRFGPGYGIRNIWEEKYKSQQTVFVCDPRK